MKFYFSLQDWYKFSPNLKKQIWPKLLTLLRNRGNGHSNEIYSRVLPFLSKVPLNVDNNLDENIDACDFFGQVLQAIWDGLFDNDKAK